jgi:hypothetical protein
VGRKSGKPCRHNAPYTWQLGCCTLIGNDGTVISRAKELTSAPDFLLSARKVSGIVHVARVMFLRAYRRRICNTISST